MQPFHTHGKPGVLVPCRSQQAAIRFFNEIRSNDHGLGLFLGPPLSGKTVVIRQVTELLASNCSVAVVDGAGKDAATLLQEILGQFGFDHGLDTVNERFAMIRVFAGQQAVSLDSPLLIIENAHAMRPVALEILCELAELGVNGKSALCIVLASHKPMSRMLEAPAMAPIAKRVISRFLLKSRNGIYVNGRRVSQQVLINDDIIALGDHRLKFIDPSARRRTALRNAGWDETTISKSIKEFRSALTKQLKLRRA